MNQTRPTIILITGHPATGKTKVANFLTAALDLPLIWKDQIKETLFDTLGWSTVDWSRQLSAATWALLYQRIELMLQTGASCMVEGNFDPTQANGRWQTLAQNYAFDVIQVRCETEADILVKRYLGRIDERHPGHVDAGREDAFLESIKQPLDWLAVEGDRLSFDTTNADEADYERLAESIRQLQAAKKMGSDRTDINQGELYWIQADTSTGSDLGYYPHPYVVVQDNLFNHSRIKTVVVCALTTNLNQAGLPGNLLLDAGEGDLPKRSVVVASKVSAVAKSQLGEYIGRLSEERVEQILAGLRFLQRSFFKR
jgi:mRNA interferase MazF